MGNHWFTRHREFSESDISATVVAFRRYIKGKGVKWNNADKAANANVMTLVKGFMFGHDDPNKNPANINLERICDSLVELTHSLNLANTTDLSPADVVKYYLCANLDDAEHFPLQPGSSNPSIFLWDVIHRDFKRANSTKSNKGLPTKCESCGGPVSLGGSCAYCGSAVISATKKPSKQSKNDRQPAVVEGGSNIAFRLLLAFAGALLIGIAFIDDGRFWYWLIAGIIPYLMLLWGAATKCPQCNQWWAAREEGSEMLDNWQETKDVPREDITRNSNGDIISRRTRTETVIVNVANH